MFVNVIESYRYVVAIADEELIGKEFTEGKKLLHIKESFYKGEKDKSYSPQEVKELIKNYKLEDATFNIVGEGSIKCAIEAGIINENQVLKIEGIPYSMTFL